MNFTTYNTLVLEMNYDKRSDQIYLEATCRNDGKNMHMRVNGNFSQIFIKETDCLGKGIPTSDETLEPEPVPNVTDMHVECSNDARLEGDVCIVQEPIRK